MNELLNLLGVTGLDSIQNIYGNISGLLGGLTTSATVTETVTETATTTGTCRRCGCRPCCCRKRCGCNNSCGCNNGCCGIMPAAETAVASATSDVTYDVTVSSYVDVPMKVINFCPGKTSPSRCGCRCNCGCCHGHHGCGGHRPGCWAR